MTETRKKKSAPTPDRDELAEIIKDSLNKAFKDSDQIAYFLDGGEDTPTDITDFISTGATMLDIAISNRPHGGIPVGRIMEMTGLEGSGKSLLGASIIANTQRKGGIAVLIDTETAVTPEFFRAVGVDTKKLVYVHLQTVEEIFDAITTIIEKVRSGSDKDKIVTIVVDSVAGASTKKEMEADFGKDGYATDKAIIISKAMRKITGLIGRQKIALIFTNQLRQKMNAPSFSDPWTTSGGKAIAYHSSVRIRLAQKGKIKNSEDEVIGVTVSARLDKNRVGPPHRSAEFDIYFNRGIDDYTSWLGVLKDTEIVSQTGAWYSYDGEKFQSKDFPAFLEANPKRKAELYEKICDALIMKYRTEFDPDAAIKVSVADED